MRQKFDEDLSHWHQTLDKREEPCEQMIPKDKQKEAKTGNKETRGKQSKIHREKKKQTEKQKKN